MLIDKPGFQNQVTGRGMDVTQLAQTNTNPHRELELELAYLVRHGLCRKRN